MARTFPGTSAGFLEALSAPVTAYPATLAAWYRPAVLADGVMLGIGKSSAGNFMCIGTDATGHAYCQSRGTSAFASVSAGVVTVGTWAHVAGVVASATSRTGYLNGVAATTDTGNSGTISALNRTNVGCVVSSGTRFTFANGALAEVAAWSVALTAGELAALAKGVSPLLIRSGSLVFYAPVWGMATERDYTAGQRHLAVTGTTVTSRPPVMPITFGAIAAPVAVAIGLEGTVSLDGTGSLAGTGSFDPVGNATLTGVGALTAGAAATVEETLDIDFPVVSQAELLIDIDYPVGYDPSLIIIDFPIYADSGIPIMLIDVDFEVRRDLGVRPFGHNRLHRTA